MVCPEVIPADPAGIVKVIVWLDAALKSESESRSLTLVRLAACAVL
jgi:hypothetical protein